MWAKDFCIVFLFRIHSKLGEHMHYAKMLVYVCIWACGNTWLYLASVYTVWGLAGMVCMQWCNGVCVHLYACSWLFESACSVHMSEGFRLEYREFILHSAVPVTQPPVHLTGRALPVLSPRGQSEGTEAWVGWRDSTMVQRAKMRREWRQKGEKIQSAKAPFHFFVSGNKWQIPPQAKSPFLSWKASKKHLADRNW